MLKTNIFKSNGCEKRNIVDFSYHKTQLLESYGIIYHFENILSSPNDESLFKVSHRTEWPRSSPFHVVVGRSSNSCYSVTITELSTKPSRFLKEKDRNDSFTICTDRTGKFPHVSNFIQDLNYLDIMVSWRYLFVLSTTHYSCSFSSRPI